jgi:hypothetical protein
LLATALSDTLGEFFTGGTMELKDRVTELARAAGVSTGIDPQQCWIDSRVRCPYGRPEGSYISRPTSFCGDSCKTFADASVEFWRSNNDAKIRDHFNDNHVTTSSELRARADEVEKGSPEQLALILAAEVIESKKLDRDILLREDLPR